MPNEITCEVCEANWTVGFAYRTDNERYVCASCVAKMLRGQFPIYQSMGTGWHPAGGRSAAPEFDMPRNPTFEMRVAGFKAYCLWDGEQKVGVEPLIESMWRAMYDRAAYDSGKG
jgi:hypothetical protein